METRENKGLSLIDFPEEYICVDVETTGLEYDRDAIIEIAAVHVKCRNIIDKFSSLVRPPASNRLTYRMVKELGFESFTDVPSEKINEILETYLISKQIEDLTGITNEMLLCAPFPGEVIPQFYNFVANHILLGHNISFDINFLHRACRNFGLALSNNFVDTLRIARKLYPELPHHKLGDIAVHLDIEQTSAHRAEADALTTIACYETMRDNISNTIGIDEFKKAFKSYKSRKYQDSLKSISSTAGIIDETNPIFNKVVVFTGALSTMGRKEAFQVVVNLGGHPEYSITKRTNFLVVGNDEFSKAMKNGKTAKMKKADDYRLKGLDIVTLSEDMFFDMIGDAQ